MADGQKDLAAAVDDLLAEVAEQGVLPPPAERARLREAFGLSQEEIRRKLGVRRTATVSDWETGKVEPRPPYRGAYIRLLAGLAKLEAQQTQPPAPASPPPAPAPQPASTPRRRGPATRTGGGAVRSRAPAARSEDRFATGPLAVLDGDGNAYAVGGLVLECPAATVTELAAWTLAARLGAERLHPHGKDADPLLVLTAAAAAELGLPETLDVRTQRLPDTHPVIRKLGKAGWRLTQRGFGPWTRIYRPVADGGTRQCVQLAVLPWGALDARDWGKDLAAAARAGQVDPADLAETLGAYAARVLTPRGGGATNGIALIEALRPPTRAVQGDDGQWVSAPVPGSLTGPAEPAPCEAPAEHPASFALFGLDRPAEQDMLEEAYDWVRPLDLLGEDEAALEWVVGLDVNLAFAAGANRLTVGLDAPQHTTRPAFDAKTPGAWFTDLSDLETDPRLPSPFTPTGTPPTGPAWYTTPTLAYAAELGHTPRPREAWLRHEAGAYLDPWYTRLAEAYKATMADLGVTTGMAEADFLTAMTHHKHADPQAAAVLTAIKATVKGGIGKLRERPQGAGYRPGEPWPALARPTWRPDIRAAVIAAARVNMHRKMLKMAAAGHYPLAVATDCVLYPAPSPSPLDVLPRTAGGKPLPGTFRLGVSPGMVKHEGSRPLWQVAEMIEAGTNPARHIKDSAVGVGEE